VWRHTGDQLRSGDLVYTRRNTKDCPLASPESQRTESITTLVDEAMVTMMMEASHREEDG